MGVLASLLPGVRELRAPLAAGYLWFVAGWVFLGGRIPLRNDATGFLKRVYELGEVLGRPAIAVGVSFAAYLIGVLSEAGTGTLLRVVANRLTALPNPGRMNTGFLEGYRTPAPVALSLQGTNSLRDAVVDRVLERLAADSVRKELLERGMREVAITTVAEVPDHIRREVIAERIESEDLIRVARDLVLLPTRLLGVQPELYGSYDRLRAEAEFRAAVSVPLIATLLALGGAHSPWWLLGVPFPLLLFAQAIMQLREAGDVLAVALRAQRKGVESPVLAEVVERQLARGDDNLSWGAFPARARAAPYAAHCLLDQAETFQNGESLSEAEWWLRRVVDAGEDFVVEDDMIKVLGYAMTRLGLLLKENDRFDEAYLWLSKAAHAGIQDAVVELGDLLLKRDQTTREQLEDLEQLLRPRIKRIHPEDCQGWDVNTRMLEHLYEVGARHEAQGDTTRADGLYGEVFSSIFPMGLVNTIAARAQRGEPGGERCGPALIENGWLIVPTEDGRWMGIQDPNQ
jgi:hypothetical protein